MRRALFLGTFVLLTAVCLYIASGIILDYCNERSKQNEQSTTDH